MNRRVAAGLAGIVLIGLVVLGLSMPRPGATRPAAPERLAVPVPVPAPRAALPPAPRPDAAEPDLPADVPTEEPARPIPTDADPESDYTPRQHLEAVEQAFADQDAELGRWHLLKALEHPDDPLAPFALYKLAWAEYNLGDRDLAIETMERFEQRIEGTSSPIYRNLQKFAGKDLDRWYEENETDAPYSPGWP